MSLLLSDGNNIPYMRRMFEEIEDFSVQIFTFLYCIRLSWLPVSAFAARGFRANFHSSQTKKTVDVPDIKIRS